MGLEVATESLRWGVNDLGGTLMEESITRMAGGEHGVRLDPPQLIGAAHAAGRPGRRAHDALRDPPPLPARGRGLALHLHGSHGAVERAARAGEAESREQPAGLRDLDVVGDGATRDAST